MRSHYYTLIILSLFSLSLFIGYENFNLNEVVTTPISKLGTTDFQDNLGTSEQNQPLTEISETVIELTRGVNVVIILVSILLLAYFCLFILSLIVFLKFRKSGWCKQ